MINFLAPKHDWNEETEALYDRLCTAERAYEHDCDNTDWVERYDGSGLFELGDADTDAWYHRACDDEDLAPLIEAAETLGLNKKTLIQALCDSAEMQETHGLSRVPRSIDSSLGVSDETELEYVDAELNAELLKLPREQLDAALEHSNGFINVTYWGPEKRPQIGCSWSDDYTGVAFVVDAGQFTAELRILIGNLA